MVIGTVIPGYQFGFKNRSSTLHPLIILKNNVETSKTNGQKSVALFMDINKAFDSVWHMGLLYKLHLVNCPKQLINLVQKWLFHRKLVVKVNESISEEFSPKQGLPQGSPLSPFLYNIYCADMYNFNRVNTDYFSPTTYILQFADDTALVSHGNTVQQAGDRLQELLGNTVFWFNKWKLKPNPAKSQLIIFNHKICRNSPTVTMYNQQIHPVSNAKYLGIHIDNKMNLNGHTALVKKSIISRAKHFSSLTYKNQGISKDTACKIYKLICRPIIEYGHQIFLTCKNPALKHLKVGETTALRKITKIRHPNNPIHNPPNQYLYDLCGMEPIEDRINELSRKFAKNQFNLQLIQPYCLQRAGFAANQLQATTLEKLREFIQ